MALVKVRKEESRRDRWRWLEKIKGMYSWYSCDKIEQLVVYNIASDMYTGLPIWACLTDNLSDIYLGNTRNP